MPSGHDVFLFEDKLHLRLTAAIADAGATILPLIQIAIKKTHNSPGIRPIHISHV